MSFPTWKQLADAMPLREVGEHHFIDERHEEAMAAFRHEHRVAAGEGGTLYTDRVT